MTAITATARAFFAAGETGEGWAPGAARRRPGASLSSQAEPLAAVTSLADDTGGRGGCRSRSRTATTSSRRSPSTRHPRSLGAFATFTGTHTGAGGPVPPTGKSIAADDVYVMALDGDRIGHPTKIWNAGGSLREFGWARGGSLAGRRGVGWAKTNYRTEV